MGTEASFSAPGISPSLACDGSPSGVEWFIDANLVGAPGAGFVAGVGGLSGSLRNRKVVLFDGDKTDADNFYGFGMNPNTLRYQIAATTAFNRWYARTATCTSQAIFSVSGTAVVTVDPAGLSTGHIAAAGALRFGSETSNTGIASKRTATGNVEGLDFYAGFRGGGFGTPTVFSIGGQGTLANGGSRFNYNGADASAAPVFSGWGSSGRASLTVDNSGTAGNDQRPMIASVVANCGAPCSQFLPPVWAIANQNASGGGLQNHGGYIGWFNPGLTAMYATIGGNQVDSLDLTAAGGATSVIRMFANGNLRVNVKSGVVNFPGVQTFASDAAAGTGGLVAGDIYKDATGGLHVKL